MCACRERDAVFTFSKHSGFSTDTRLRGRQKQANNTRHEHQPDSEPECDLCETRTLSTTPQADTSRPYEGTHPLLSVKVGRGHAQPPIGTVETMVTGSTLQAGHHASPSARYSSRRVPQIATAHRHDQNASTDAGWMPRCMSSHQLDSHGISGTKSRLSRISVAESV